MKPDATPPITYSVPGCCGSATRPPIAEGNPEPDRNQLSPPFVLSKSADGVKVVGTGSPVKKVIANKAAPARGRVASESMTIQSIRAARRPELTIFQWPPASVVLRTPLAVPRDNELA